jgi:hypothetical protein
MFAQLANGKQQEDTHIAATRYFFQETLNQPLQATLQAQSVVNMNQKKSKS